MREHAAVHAPRVRSTVILVSRAVRCRLRAPHRRPGTTPARPHAR